MWVRWLLTFYLQGVRRSTAFTGDTAISVDGHHLDRTLALTRPRLR